MVVFWGHEFYPLPRKFGIVMLHAIQKRFNLGVGQAKDTVYNGLAATRTRGRADLRNYVLRRRREPNPHPVWQLLVKDALMRYAKHAWIVDLPLPPGNDHTALSEYACLYAEAIEREYIVSFMPPD